MQQLFAVKCLFLIFSLALTISCRDIAGPYYYRVASSQIDFPGIKAEELEDAILQHLVAKDSPESYCVELSLVRYSSGKETYSFSDSEEGITVSHGDVMLEVMVRIKKQDTTHKVFFVKSSGADKHVALAEMAKKLGKELNTEKKQ